MQVYQICDYIEKSWGLSSKDFCQILKHVSYFLQLENFLWNWAFIYTQHVCKYGQSDSYKLRADQKKEMNLQLLNSQVWFESEYFTSLKKEELSKSRSAFP